MHWQLEEVGVVILGCKWYGILTLFIPQPRLGNATSQAATSAGGNAESQAKALKGNKYSLPNS